MHDAGLPLPGLVEAAADTTPTGDFEFGTGLTLGLAENEGPFTGPIVDGFAFPGRDRVIAGHFKDECRHALERERRCVYGSVPRCCGTVFWMNGWTFYGVSLGFYSFGVVRQEPVLGLAVICDIDNKDCISQVG